MAITENILISPRNLVNNPIPVSMYCADNVTFMFEITDLTHSNVLYSGSLTSMTDYSTIDISDIFSLLLPKAGVIDAKIELIYSGEIIANFSVYGGGISKAMRRRLIQLNTDIFTEKLKNSSCNFFLTSRTMGKLVVIPEDELLPLYYYAKGHNFVVKCNGEVVDTYNHSADVSDSLQEIDFAALRKSIALTQKKLVSHFEIYTASGVYACTILIASVERTHRYFLKFMNSWGIYELIALSDNIEFDPGFSDVEKIQAYDNTILEPVNKQKRKTITPKLNISTESGCDTSLLIDAIISDECYLVIDGTEYSVNLKPNTSVFQSTETQSETISMVAEIMDSDGDYSMMITEIYRILAANGKAVIANNSKVNI